MRLAQAHYGHCGGCSANSCASAGCRRQRKTALVRVENIEALVAALAQGKGVLCSPAISATGKWRRSPGIGNYPEMRGRFHFVRRAIKPRVARRARHAPLQARPGSACSPSAARSTRSSTARGRRHDRVPVRSARAPAGRHRGRFLRPSGVDVQEPRDHRARHRRAGAARDELARAGRTSRAALRGRRSRPSSAPTRTRRSAATRAPTTRRWSASSCATRSSGTGCTDAGNPSPTGDRRRERAPEGSAGALRAARASTRRGRAPSYAWAFPLPPARAATLPRGTDATQAGRRGRLARAVRHACRGPRSPRAPARRFGRSARPWKADARSRSSCGFS